MKLGGHGLGAKQRLGGGCLKDFGGITWFPGGTEGDQSVLTEYKGKRD